MGYFLAANWVDQRLSQNRTYRHASSTWTVLRQHATLVSANATKEWIARQSHYLTGSRLRDRERLVERDFLDDPALRNMVAMACGLYQPFYP
jgi:hypothetical protein